MKTTKKDLELEIAELRRTLFKTRRRRERAEEMSVKAWEEHRFAVEQIGKANREAEAWRLAANQAVDIAREDMKARCVEACSPYNLAADQVRKVPIKT